MNICLSVLTPSLHAARVGYMAVITPCNAAQAIGTGPFDLVAVRLLRVVLALCLFALALRLRDFKYNHDAPSIGAGRRGRAVYAALLSKLTAPWECGPARGRQR